MRLNFAMALQILTALCLPGMALAVEGGVGFYLMGQNINQAAVMPPPGLFFQFDEYLYNGETSSSEAIAENGRLDIGVEADAAISLLTGAWTPPVEIAGGQPMFTATFPFGYQKVSGDAQFSLDGIQLKNRFSESDVLYGDPVLGLSLGWKKEAWHWSVLTLFNIPVGDYDKDRTTNIAFNRWGFDLSGAVTWLDPAAGWEISLKPGFTFNGENDDTDYESGTEFHLEARIAKLFANGWSAGLVGYYYNQLSDDKGAGAPDDGFRGEVAAIGPAVTYNASLMGIPVSLGASWYHEFNADNRTEGDAVFINFAMPLAVFD